MKCINCGVDNNLKERTANQGRCKNCNHTFAFEPQSTDAKYKFTDPFFQKIITELSANGTLNFTPKQLFYVLDKRIAKKKNQINVEKLLSFLLIFPFSIFTYGISAVIGIFILIIISFKQTKSQANKSNVRKGNAKFIQVSGIAILIVGILYSLAINLFPLFVISVVLGMTLIYFGTTQINSLGEIPSLAEPPDTLTINQDLFQGWVNRWQQINGAITNMLPYVRPSNSPANINPDITAYSFDRVVICDSAEIAQLLIANNFHFENNCAVLSITGYPENIFSTVMEMLRRNPDLKVYALHDASPRGVTLINHLRTSPNWFLNTDVTIYDLGLLPRQFITKSKAFIQEKEEYAKAAKKLSIDIKRDLTEAEIAWLESGKFIELESFTPKRLLQVVTQGIAKSQQPDIQPDSGGTTFIGAYDNYDNDSDRNITIFAVDTFG
jgi:DNA-directed RNA polymerase subunit RPC12/RpoP